MLQVNTNMGMLVQQRWLNRSSPCTSKMPTGRTGTSLASVKLLARSGKHRERQFDVVLPSDGDPCL